MIQDFRDKVAVVTGAGGGIGAALAEGLASEGMRVIAADIDEAGARATAAKIPGVARAVQVDVAREASVADLAEASFDAFGQVDLLVNNAGVFQGGLAWERSAADWEWTFGVNVFGIVHAIRHFVPRMIAQGTEGHVVNTASVAAFVAGPTSSPYVVSKCAALSLTECLALDLAAVGSQIGASVLTPSAFDTGIAATARVRPERYGSDASPDGKGTAESLAAMTRDGMPPVEAVAPVIAAIRSGEFLIPTKPSYAEQIRSRYDALLERRLPPLLMPD
ncbi:MAG: SDR family NAD(P)-dependent oxidoreductase [Deltaproteobacteria bacterium]|nr:SDR family NAD(P)-dependent oxidoreductase [Deltaproteobacteria bacterium]MBW2363222.1 SDR family NAD(P)-dependent oxidoreductase [Deltaproteobacteria bacterium]